MNYSLPDSASAREAARRDNGEFGTQEHARPGRGLDASDGGGLGSQTPVEIDTQLAELYAEKFRADRKVEGLVDRIRGEVQPDHWRRGVTPLPDEEVIDKALVVVDDPEEPDYKKNTVRKHLAEFQAGLDEQDRIFDEICVLDDEFRARGGWTRAFLVDNSNGHVHSSMGCSTCFPTTRYAWMTDYSGGTEESVVEDAGERACTVCYPSAPVETLNRPTKMFTPDEKAAAVAREERAQAKVAREAKKLAAAILPTGEPLKVPSWSRDGVTHFDRIQSTVSARSRLTDLVEEWRTNESAEDREAKQILAEAIASKEGKSVEDVLAEAKVRAKKRK